MPYFSTVCDSLPCTKSKLKDYNADGLNLETTVPPFILRGIRLIGIDSVAFDQKKRQEIWSLLANEWKISGNVAVTMVKLEAVVEVAQELKVGRHLGRTIVEIS
ncbi:hypothetical protein [Streptococcus sp. NLN76]|uniref:hypothetical protein n=1 Tax=Streptococcus sp. NLN76 TaxID=2822800 RepID=UPI0018AA36B5|nr:hypothetical protein [Streptococcus sp. NLN76]MBF8969721.1 hypothetical protein [Streptococcus sp. NLN76]